MYVFTFNSTSAAIFAEQVLLQAAVKVKVMPLPSKIAAGCGIALRVSQNELTKAKQIIKENQVIIHAIYFKQIINEEAVYQIVKGE